MAANSRFRQTDHGRNCTTPIDNHTLSTGRVEFYLRKGQRYDIALLPVDWELQARDDASLRTRKPWIRLAKLVATDSKRRAVVVR